MDLHGTVGFRLLVLQTSLPMESENSLELKNGRGVMDTEPCFPGSSTLKDAVIENRMTSYPVSPQIPIFVSSFAFWVGLDSLCVLFWDDC